MLPVVVYLALVLFCYSVGERREKCYNVLLLKVVLICKCVHIKCVDIEANDIVVAYIIFF